MKPQGIVFDVEADGFFMESTTLWCVVLKDINDPTKTLKIKPFEDLFAKQKILEFIGKYNNPIICGHYILGYDVFMLLKFLGITFSVGFKDSDTFNGQPCTYVDTFYMSMYLDADREAHSLEYFGSILGLPKIDWRAKAVELGLITNQSPKGAEFKQWHEEMGVYCDRDCGVNVKAFWSLFGNFESIYGKWGGAFPEHFRCGQKGFFLMSCQEFTGWKLDQDYANELIPKIQEMMKEIEDNVLPKLPPRKLKKGEEKEYSMPKNPFKKDGSFSHHMLNFIEKHKGLVHDHGIDFYGKIYKVESQKLLDVKLPMEIKDSEDLKHWFRGNGWVPSMYNFQRGPDGKPMRDAKGKLIPTSPKMQEAGKLCPNLEALDGDLPKQIVKYLSLRNRLSVLTGWMDNWRLPLDGRIGASRTGITPTHRQKHSVLVNIPKGSEKVLLGKEFRSLWIVEMGRKLVSVDQAGLEARVMGHYTHRYDNGFTADELLNGDPHSKNAFAFFEPELRALGITIDNFNKEDPKFKPFRDRSKNGFYALLYGCSAAKLASTLGLPESRGDMLLERFWNANPATKQLKDNVTKFWETNGQKKWLPAIDGRRLSTRKKSALLNTLFQSCGAISMDYAICFIDDALGGIKFDSMFRPYYDFKNYEVKRVGYMHDQTDWESPPEVAEDLKELIEECYVEAGVYLKLKVPLAGDGKVGVNLFEVH